MSIPLRLICLSISILFASGSALAEPRIALVIGNSAYRNASELPNPRNDAADISAALKAVGFKVIEGVDLDKATMDRKIGEFASALEGAEAALFFYAGHGLQVGGANYLVPVDAKLSTAASLDFEMVRLDLIQRTMEREAPTNLLFLDACRDNPLARNLARAMGTRSASIGRGLAAAESGVGTLISFSTQPGNVALDGTGRNSPFAAALVKQITTSSDALGDLLISVRNEVMQSTGKKQVPWEHSALTGRFYFRSGEASTSIPLTVGDGPAQSAALPRTPDAGSTARDPNDAVAIATPPSNAVAEPDNVPTVTGAPGSKQRFNVKVGSSAELTSQGIILAVRDPDLQRNSVGVKIAGRSTRMGIGQEFPLAPYGGGSCKLGLLNVNTETVGFLLRC